jgi:hypothetical protein
MNVVKYTLNQPGLGPNLLSVGYGFPIRGPLSCIMLPAATFANYVYSVQNQIYSLLLLAYVQPANQPTVTGVAIFHAVGQFFSTAWAGPVPGPGVNYTGLREVLLEVVILVF